MLVYGHRGAAGEAPENTIAAFRHAIERGTQYVELDIHLSKDGQLIVVHDDKVNRTTGQKGRVNTFSAAELKKMDARQGTPPWPNKKLTGIPTLDAVLEATPEFIGYNIEVKPAGIKARKQIAQLLAEKYSTSSKAKNIVITSSDQLFLQEIMERAPHIPRGYVSMLLDPFAVIEKYQCQYLSTEWTVINSVLIRRAHKMDLHVSAWTVNSDQTIANLYKMNVDSVITDYPSMALPLVGRLLKK